MAVIESDAAGEPSIRNARRPANSNIGVRRRPLSSQRQGTVTRPWPQSSDDSIAYPNVASQDKRFLGLDRQNARRPDRVQKDERIKDTNAALCDESTSPGISFSIAASGTDTPRSNGTVYDTYKIQASRDSSDTDSLASILINPTIDILPVAKTQQARASFDFCQ